MAVEQKQLPPSKYLTYALATGALNTRMDPHRISREDLAVSQNAWLTPTGVVSKRPGIGSFAGGAITNTGTTGSTGRTPTAVFQGTSVVRFNNVSYLVVLDELGAYFVFPKYPGNTVWYYIGFSGTFYSLTNNVAQLYDPTLAEPTCFFPGAPNIPSPPLTWTGVTTAFAGAITSGSNKIITPSGNSGMNGIYVNQKLFLGQNTASFETVTVTAVSGTTFTATLANNHLGAQLITGQLASVGTAPLNFGGSLTIAPLYSETLFSNLFYAGELTAPTAVYTSDPYFPESFTSNYFQSTIYPGAYQPALVGHNDGVAGGDITGLRRLGTSMLVYKQTAIYSLSLVSLYGDMVWQVEIVSPTIGCIAPNSIVSFDSFHVFLSVDGVYKTDGLSVQRIDWNVPTFFDQSGINGQTTVISYRASAVGARYGSVYELYYNVGFPSYTYPDRGIWFDFEIPDPMGFPSAGEILLAGALGGVSGVAAMRGPADTGTLAFVSAANNLIGEFGQATVYGDLSNNTAVTLTLKADMLEDFPIDGALIAQTIVETVVLAVGGLVSAGSVTFTVSLNGVGAVATVTASGTGPPAVQYCTVNFADVAVNTLLNQVQISITESSTKPWSLFGVVAAIDVKAPVVN